MRLLILPLMLALVACSNADDAPPPEAALTPAATAEAASSASPAAIIPEALVQQLYAEETIPTEPETIRHFFAEDMVVPLTPTADGSLVTFDYRIDGQEGAADNLQLEETAGGPDGGVVEARFVNGGEPRKVIYTVCRQDDGVLKIVEAATEGSTGWSLRRILELPERPEGCA